MMTVERKWFFIKRGICFYYVVFMLMLYEFMWYNHNFPGPGSPRQISVLMAILISVGYVVLLLIDFKRTGFSWYEDGCVDDDDDKET